MGSGPGGKTSLVTKPDEVQPAEPERVSKTADLVKIVDLNQPSIYIYYNLTKTFEKERKFCKS
jgi:ribosomal protein S26